MRAVAHGNCRATVIGQRNATMGAPPRARHSLAYKTLVGHTHSQTSHRCGIDRAATESKYGEGLSPNSCNTVDQGLRERESMTASRTDTPNAANHAPSPKTMPGRRGHRAASFNA